MSRRRLLELLVALAILVLLLTVIFVRPTGRPPGVPGGPTGGPGPGGARVALFRPEPGAPPDFASSSFQAIRVPAPGDSARSAVLYPVEFEMPADLWVVAGPGAGTRLAIADSLRATRTPKNVGWLDADRLWVTVGHLYGTVSPGGDLWEVDPGDGSARILWASPDSGRTQAVGAEAGAGGGIRVRLKAFDANLIEARDSLAVLGGER